MLDCGSKDWGQFLLVQGGVKPAAIVGFWLHDPTISSDGPLNPFASKFRGMEELEEHMTETGVLFETDGAKCEDVGSAFDSRTYSISKDKAKLDEFRSMWEEETSVRGIEERTGALLGYPEEAVKNFHLRERNLYLIPESVASYAVMKLRGREVPAWFHYVWHVPVNQNLLGDFSESSVRLAEEYAAFFQEFHPKYHEWHLRVSEESLETLVSDIKYIVDMWESSAEN